MPQITEGRNRKSKFERFILSYGVILLAVELSVQPSAVYHWLRGATAPRPVNAEIVQRLARERGVRLSLEQIYGHFHSLRAAKLRSEQSLEASASARILAG